MYQVLVYSAIVMASNSLVVARKVTIASHVSVMELKFDIL